MCGRFTLAQSAEAIARQFHLVDLPPVEPHYNIAPTQPAPVVRLEARAQARQFDYLYWGLIPSWAKDIKMGAKLINARSETVAEKPAFRAAVKRRRCLILADGFYEWQRTGKTKQPYYFYLPVPALLNPDLTSAISSNPQPTQGGETNRQLFALAGLWEHWQDADGNEVESCTILTTAANALLATMHDRMPVILHSEDYDRWLDPTIQSVESLRSLFDPYPAEEMDCYPVSSSVNTARFDTPDCIQPISLEQ
jgi:putative SOS response-associated peptidase YedK